MYCCCWVTRYPPSLDLPLCCCLAKIKCITNVIVLLLEIKVYGILEQLGQINHTSMQICLRLWHLCLIDIEEKRIVL